MDHLVEGSISAEALRCAVANAIEEMTMMRGNSVKMLDNWGDLRKWPETAGRYA